MTRCVCWTITPIIEVRLFNPFSFRILRALGYLTDFALDLNRRMHATKVIPLTAS